MKHSILLNSLIPVLLLMVLSWVYLPSVKASTRLVVPVYTAHIVEKGNYQYNESNPGLGLEYRTHNYHIGYMHAVNSYGKPANYLYIAKPIIVKGFSLGLLSMTNQAITYSAKREVTKYGTILTPILAYEYKSFRLSTSYPFAKLSTKADDIEKADLVNIQFIYKF